jgi:predicted RND superfamily exporter protein
MAAILGMFVIGIVIGAVATYLFSWTFGASLVDAAGKSQARVAEAENKRLTTQVEKLEAELSRALQSIEELREDKG